MKMDHSQSGWLLAVHGGAKHIAPEERDANREGCARAIAAGRAILERGGDAVDAVEAAVRILEDDPAFNAGYGSELNVAGEVEMCAAVMRGSDFAVGAVGAIQGVRHPVAVARLLINEREILLAGDGAHAFARDHGAELCNKRDLIAKEPAESADHDTVGAVARDVRGNFASATSTGGLSGQLVGRMGDSALPGCGYYADNRIGAVALSGDGEAIARLATASAVMRSMPMLGPEEALKEALSRLPELDGDGGGIALARTGEIGWWHNSPHFAVAIATAARPDAVTWLSKDEK